MSSPGQGGVVGHHQKILDYVEDFCLRVRPNIPEEGKHIKMDCSLYWKLTKKEVKWSNWGGRAELENATEGFVMEGCDGFESAGSNGKCRKTRSENRLYDDCPDVLLY